MKRAGGLLLVIATIALGLATEAAAQAGQSWEVYGGTLANTRYSTLGQVTTANVTGLYITSSHGPKNVFAVDARTGVVRWRYSPEVPAAATPRPSRWDAARSTSAARTVTGRTRSTPSPAAICAA